jgi:hypothetical protein
VGDFAYVADYDSLQIVDIRDRAPPTELGGVDTPDVAAGVDVVGDLAYVADGRSGLQMVDVRDPAAPTTAGSFDTPGRAAVTFEMVDLPGDGHTGEGLMDDTLPLGTRRLLLDDCDGLLQGDDLGPNAVDRAFASFAS